MVLTRTRLFQSPIVSVSSSNKRARGVCPECYKIVYLRTNRSIGGHNSSPNIKSYIKGNKEKGPCLGVGKLPSYSWKVIDDFWAKENIY